MKAEDIVLYAGKDDRSRLKRICSWIQDKLLDPQIKVRRGLNNVCRRISSSLFGTLVVWLFLGAFVFTLIGRIWAFSNDEIDQGFFSIWMIDGAESPLERVKVALTMVGGVGAVGYLVIRYRERSSEERAERRRDDEYVIELIQNGTGQLASDSPTVRIAGAYVLADIADNYGITYRQRVISILCGYLRTDRGSIRTQHERLPWPSISPDASVESTILRLISDHLSGWRRPDDGLSSVPRRLYPDDMLWQTCEIDLHGAVLTEDVDFSDAVFIGRIDFSGASFHGRAKFKSARFGAAAHFESVGFYNEASFEESEFRNSAHFSGSFFTQLGSSPSGHRTYVSFDRATFLNSVSFEGSQLSTSDTSFEDAKFDGGLRSHGHDPVGPSVVFPTTLMDSEDGILPAGAFWSDLSKNE